MKLKEPFDDFKKYLKRKKYSPRTITSYISNALKFFSFLEKYYHGIDELEKITKQIIIDYQNYLTNYQDKNHNTLSSTTQKLRLISVRKYFKYLIDNDLIIQNPAVVITLPREEQRIVRNTLTEKEIFEILKNIKLDSPLGLRNKAIVELVYSCGIRTTECCDIMINDLNFKEQTLTIVKGKGNKSRILPLTHYACTYVSLYINKARRYFIRNRKTDPGYLFLSSRGNPFNRSTINKCVIRSVLRNLKFNKRITFYSFRHTIASQLLANDLDISYIAQLLGHSNLETTQKYTRIEISDLKKVHSKYHPREKNIVVKEQNKK